MKTHPRNQSPGPDSMTKELCQGLGGTGRPPGRRCERAFHGHGRSTTRKTRWPIPLTLNAKSCETYRWQIYQFEFTSERLFPAGSSMPQKRSTRPQDIKCQPRASFPRVIGRGRPAARRRRSCPGGLGTSRAGGREPTACLDPRVAS